MVLVPEPDTSTHRHSQLIWWADDHDHNVTGNANISQGGRFLWSPVEDDSANLGYIPHRNFIPTTLAAPAFNVFCAAIGTTSTGEVIAAGGTKEAENGQDTVGIYYPALDRWRVLPNKMHSPRWYPDLTTLATGQVLITSGSRFRHMWIYGGTPSPDSNLYRAPVAHGVGWDPSVLPLRDTSSYHRSRPIPTRGHSATYSLGGYQVYFGGTQVADSSKFQNDFWMLTSDKNNFDGTDYVYFWQARDVDAGAPKPSGRAFHSAAVIDTDSFRTMKKSALLVFGGRVSLAAGSDAASNEVWTVALRPGNNLVDWNKAFPSGDVPSKRFGHASIWSAAHHRLYVFGGSDGSGVINDANVYSLQMTDSTHCTWRKCTILNPLEGPAPRSGCATGEIERRYTTTVDAKGLMMYGGRVSSTQLSDSLFVLWLVSPDVVQWQRVAQNGTHPAVEWASGTANENAAEFWILGGKNASGVASAASYSFGSQCTDCSHNWPAVSWSARTSAPTPLWGHTAPQYENEIFMRTPEILNLADSTFTELTSAKLIQDWYPHTFVLPGSGKVYCSGPSLDGSLLTLSGTNGATSTRSVVPSTPSSLRGGSSIMYRPGKIMKCGSRDTDGGRGTVAIGTTQTIDMTSASPAWTNSGDMQRPRGDFNLVLMPDGKAIAVGGFSILGNGDNDHDIFVPEIWDPDANGGLGAWDGGQTVGAHLDASHYYRGYHSSGLLLPDGRVFCASGNATTDYATQSGQPYFNHQVMADIYSPPYLFNADGTRANRPVIDVVPRRVGYGEDFTLRVLSDTTHISRIALIRTPAVTHGYDESQRYVPLTVVPSGIDSVGHYRYFRLSTPDSTSAPPGEYMLFVVNAQGTPGIARWIRIGTTNGSTQHPRRVLNLTKVCSLGTSAQLSWTAPGADSTSVAPGPSRQYEFRYKTSSMSTWSLFSGGTLAAETPWPGDPFSGVADQITINSLTPSTRYYFRLTAKNWVSNTGNWSALSNEASFFTYYEDCGGAGGGGGGGGGGFSARRVGNFSLRRPGMGQTVDTTFVENTLLPGAATGVTARDLVALPLGPHWNGNAAQLRLSRAGARTTHVDSLVLIAVDHAAGEQTFVRGHEIVAGTTGPVTRVVHADGRDLSSSLAQGEAFEGQEGDTLYAEFTRQGPGQLVLSSSKAHLVLPPDRTGIQIDCETPQGWLAVGHHDPRERESDEVFAAANLHRVRLVFHGVHRLTGIEEFLPGSGVTTSVFTPAATNHVRLGEVASQLTAAGGGVDLGPGDWMTASFGVDPGSVSPTRDWYMDVTGSHHDGGPVSASMARATETASALPTQFALSRSRPNPFKQSTLIGFDVPVRSAVRVDVFDVQGRKVATLASGGYAPGSYSVEWNGQTAGGAPAPAGVYLCRLTAGSFRTEQHMILVR